MRKDISLRLRVTRAVLSATMVSATMVSATMVSLGALMAAPALAAPSPESQSYLQDAQQYLKKGDARAAVIQLKNAVRADPENAEARLNLGLAYLLSGDAPSAEKELRVALSKGGDEARAAPALARALLIQGKFDEVVRQVPRGQRPAASESEVLLWHGYALGANRDKAGAESAFREAMRLNPADSRPVLGLSQLIAEGGDKAAAEALADQAVALAKEPAARADALAAKGDLRRQADDAEAARRLYDEALMADPGNRTALLGRAFVLLGKNEIDAAERDLRTLADVAPAHPAVRYLQAVVQVSRQNPGAALDLLQANGGTSYPPALLLQAMIHLDRNEMQQAQSMAERYAAAMPADARGRKLLAQVLMRQGKADQALPLLAPLAEALPQDLEVAGLLATAHLQAGNASKAAEWLEKVATLTPDDPEALTRLAMGRMRLGQTGAAVKELEEAAQLEKEGTTARMLLVLAHVQSGKYDEAMTVADAIEAEMAGSPVPHNLKGGIALARKDAAAARASFEKALALQPDFLPALFNMAAIERGENKPDQARKRYEAVLKAEPRNVKAMLSLAELEAAQNRPEQVLAWFDKAEAADPKALQPRLARVDYLLSRKEPQRAMAAARAAQQAHPDSAAAVDALARAQWAAGEKASAITTFRQVTGLAPKSPQAHLRLAQALRQNGDEAGAIRAIEQAVALDDRFLAGHGERIGIELAAGRADAAIKLARDWQARHKDERSGFLLVGETLAQAGRHDEAVAVYTQAAEKQRDAAVVQRIADALRAGGKTDKAIAEMKRWVDANPADAGSKQALAVLYLTAKQYDQALALHEALVAQGAENALLLNNLAWMYGQRGDARAIPTAEKAYKLAPDAPAVADTLGYLLVQARQTERGLTLLKQAHEAAPEAAEIGYHYAVALKQAGRPAEARSVLSRVTAGKTGFEEEAAARDMLKELGGSGG